MAPPKDIARSYPKRGLTADVGFRSEPKFCGDGSAEYAGTNGLQFDGDHTFVNGFSVAGWYWVDGTQTYNYAGFAGTTIAWGFPSSGTYLNFYQKATSTAHQTVGGTLTPKQWNHIAFTLSQDGLTIKAYLNGVELTITQPSVAIVLPSLTNIAEAGIAAFQHSASGAALSLPYGGQMANQIWYDGVLTQDEVRQLMRAPNYAVASTIVTPQFYFELFSGITDSTGNATTVEDRGTTTTVYGVKKPQLPRGLDLARGAAMARVYTGRAVDFDGSADGAASTATLNINTSGAKATLACWVNPDGSTAGNKTIVSNTIDTNNNQFTIYQNGTSYAVSAVYASGFTKVNYFADSQVKVGAWTFLCAVWDFDTTSLTFYVDGVSFTDTPSTAIGSTNGVFEIGCRDPSGSKSQLFDGQIASIKLFDTTLTAAQVRELYHNPEQVLPTGVSASNLRRYYPLSDYNDTGGTGGRYFQDMGADGEPAEDKGSSEMAFAQPVPCPQLGLQQSATRLFFAGDTSQVVTASSVTSLGSSFAVAFWVQKEAGVQVFIETDLIDQVYYDGSQLYYYSASGGANVMTGASMAPGEWHHVVVTYGAVYLNGASVATFPSGGWFGTTNYFGRRASAALPFNGIMANVTYWDENLTSAEALELYNQGIGYDPRNDTGNYTSSSDVVHYWQFDDLSTVVDRVGSANGTVTGTFTAASFPENASGSTIVGDFSMKRKGVSVLNAPGSGRATLAANSSLLPATGGGYTLCAFVRLQSTDDDAAVIMSTSTGTNEWGTFYEGSTNKYKIVLSDGTTNILDRAFSGTVTDSEWHHIAWTIQLDATTANGETYIDGAPDLSFTRSSFNTPPTPSEFAIGYDPGNADKQANAAIACLRIYQSVLSANEIKQVYSSDLRLIKGLANE